MALLNFHYMKKIAKKTEFVFKKFYGNLKVQT